MAAQIQGDDDLITAINVTPLVDIILVLLIIFMVAAEVIHEQEAPTVIDIDLPTAVSGEKLLERGLLNLVIDKDGQLHLNGKPVEMAQVSTAIETIANQGGKPRALITADKRTAHGNVVALMDLLRTKKVANIAINTREQVIE